MKNDLFSQGGTGMAPISRPTAKPQWVFENTSGKDVTTSLLIAQIFGKRHSDVLKKIREIECSAEFQERNFSLMVEMKPLPQGGATKSEYYELTRDGFTMAVMGYTGKKAAGFKEAYINEFNKRTELLKSLTEPVGNEDLMILNAMKVLIRRNEEYELQLQEANKTILEKEEIVKELAPLADYTVRVLNSTDTMTTTQIAKDLGTNAANLNKILHYLGIQFRQGKNWYLYSKYDGLGYTDARTHTIQQPSKPDKVVTNTVWTQKGRAFIIDALTKSNWGGNSLNTPATSLPLYN